MSEEKILATIVLSFIALCSVACVVLLTLH
jgi:hypothetical protein